MSFFDFLTAGSSAAGLVAADAVAAGAGAGVFAACANATETTEESKNATRAVFNMNSSLGSGSATLLQAEVKLTDKCPLKRRINKASTNGQRIKRNAR